MVEAEDVRSWGGGGVQLWEWGRDWKSQEGTGLQLLSFQQQVTLAHAAMSETTGVLRISRGLEKKGLPQDLTTSCHTGRSGPGLTAETPPVASLKPRSVCSHLFILLTGLRQRPCHTQVGKHRKTTQSRKWWPVSRQTLFSEPQFPYLYSVVKTILGGLCK